MLVATVCVQLCIPQLQPPRESPVAPTTSHDVSATGSGIFLPCLAASAPGAPSPAGLHGAGMGVDGSMGGLMTRPTCEYRSWLAKNSFQCCSAYHVMSVSASLSTQPSLTFCSWVPNPRVSCVRCVSKQPVTNERDASRPALQAISTVLVDLGIAKSLTSCCSFLLYHICVDWPRRHTLLHQLRRRRAVYRYSRRTLPASRE